MKLIFILTFVLLAPLTFAQSPDIGLISVSSSAAEETYSVKLELLILLTALAFIPAFVLMTTCFTRIIIVLVILRQALGLQQSPPNQILIGIALALSLLIMKPVWSEIHSDAFQPYDRGDISLVDALSIAEQPVRRFMLSQTHAKSLEQMMHIANEPLDTPVESLSFAVLLPAFVISELTTAFQIGFIIFIPFLIIDLIIASILMSMGMMMLSPLIISLPFKLILFVLADGWTMTVGTLTASFGGAG